MTAFSPFFPSRRVAFSLVSAAFALAGIALPVHAQTPTIAYTPQGDRQLIFVNNPERIELGYTDMIPGSTTQNVLYNDLGDGSLGRKALLKILLPPGKYRDSFEHVWNFTRNTVRTESSRPVNYGVVLRNPGTTDVIVTMRGKGFINNSNGNIPFVELFTNPTVQTVTLRPGSFLWLMRTEADYGNTRSVPSGNFFAGVVDFDFTGASCELMNIVYQSSAAVTGTVTSPKAIVGSDATVQQLDYIGFVTRRYGAGTTPAPESRVYKGLMMAPNTETSGSDVLTTPTFTISDATPAGELPVTYPQYLRNNATGQHEPSSTMVSNTFWITHESPLRDTSTRRAVGSDMFDTEMPGFGTVFALRNTVAPNTGSVQPNIANWSVVYRDRITVRNTGNRSRNVSLTLANQGGGGAPIAYQANNGTWQRTSLTTTPFAYRTFTVPAGRTVTVEGVFTLGAPAVGTVRHAVQVTNAALRAVRSGSDVSSGDFIR
ncbi:MAG: hypothetical protein H7Y38_20580 [Armatimonadetes bacterium]|nr:hypothetical protein [Armatimonadota bacterium]